MAVLIGDHRPEEGLRNRDRVIHGNLVRSEAEDVRPVVLTGDGRIVHRRAKRRADVLETIRRHAHAHASPADENAEISSAERHVLRHLGRVIGIVATLAVSRTPVRHLIRARKRLDERPLQLEPAMVRPNRNLHRQLLVEYCQIQGILYQKLTSPVPPR